MDMQSIRGLQCIAIIEPKYKKVSFSGTEKYWSDFFYPNLYVYETVCHFTNPVLKCTNIKCMERQL